MLRYAHVNVSHLAGSIEALGKLRLKHGRSNMLTDIFANRYSNKKLWDAVGESERRFIVQGFRILIEQLRPYYVGGHIDASGKNFWTDLQSRMSMELGLQTLSPVAYAYKNLAGSMATGIWEYDYICKVWMFQEYNASLNADRFVKERISLIEMGFRRCGEMVAESNAQLPALVASIRQTLVGRNERKGLVLSGDPAHELVTANAKANATYTNCVNELNERFRQAGTRLHYHNGFVQLVDDDLSTKEIKSPFWEVVADPKWKNVDLEMKEAADRRDNGSVDAAFHAAKALESTIKIISKEKNLTTEKERGASNYIDNLVRGSVIEVWESEILKMFFSKVRNPMGHGAGDASMPKLNSAQTDWAIEYSMTWSKSLIRRL